MGGSHGATEPRSHGAGEPRSGQEDLSPTVRSLKGILKGHQVDEAGYRDYLAEKYR